MITQLSFLGIGGASVSVVGEAPFLLVREESYREFWGGKELGGSSLGAEG